MHITPATPLEKIRRINDKQKKALKHLGISTAEDLLYFFPSRYGDIAQIKHIRDIEHDDMVTVYGKILDPHIKKSFRTRIPMAEAAFEDIAGDTMKIVWFNQAFIAKTLRHEQLVKLTGKATITSSGTTLTNPEIEKIKSLPVDVHDSLFHESTQKENFGFPIYRETRGITSKWIYHTILKILSSGYTDNLIDPIPEYILQKFNLPSLATALVWIHTPQNHRDADAARKRFAFEEVFAIQTAKQRNRKEYEARYSYSLDINQSSVDEFIDRFPFDLTNAQNNATCTILGDIQRDIPMSRLLEGDVGSGKTAVAAAAVYAVATQQPRNQSYGNLQVAYMAPTEVLATQLFENFIKYFDGTGLSIGLVTGSGCKKFPSKVSIDGWTNISRNQLQKWIDNGEIPIVIGTHALISKKVTFKHLGLVIIDEQHRFGTKQRMGLANKDGHMPHYLSMTATPIPRTLALTIYGDLDLSIIDEYPAGRKSVITNIIQPDKRDDVYEEIRERLKEGRQAYVICPRIFGAKEEDKETNLSPQKLKALQMKSVIEESERLQKEVFPDYRIGIMHSKMKKDEKESIMADFYEHRIDILVSTSVVEVGVNIPNATTIIIEGAERFGLAQLHQLRGRVQRSTTQAYCYLFTNTTADTSIERLQSFTKAKNGFELAEMDLMLRGSGDLAGIKQWGMSDLAMEAIKNIKMVEAARNSAQEIINEDPHLDNFPELTNYLKKKDWDIHFE